MTDWTLLSDAEFWAEHLAITEEASRRRTLEQAPARQNDLNVATLAAEGIVSGSLWRQPSGGHDAYPINFVVEHNGKTWISLVSANVWEPGISAWREQADTVPDWVQPTGAHDAYSIGDRVLFNGGIYESTIDSNVWSPLAYPSGWLLIQGPS